MPSTVIRQFQYHAGERRLEVVFQTGRRYSYHDVPANVADAMRQSFSKGEYFNREIKDVFPYRKANENR